MVRVIKGKNLLKSAVIIGSALVLLTIGSITAYFTDTESKTNTWTVGNVDINLDEVEYDKAEDERNNITPNQFLTKDPVVTNTGSNDAYIFMKITVPKKTLKVASDDGKSVTNVSQELFTYNIDPGWILVKNSSYENSNEYVYAYGSDECVALAPQEKTPSLFLNNQIRFINIVEGQGLEGQTIEMPVEAFGIQTNNITEDNAKTPSAVWAVLDRDIVEE